MSVRAPSVWQLDWVDLRIWLRGHRPSIATQLEPVFLLNTTHCYHLRTSRGSSSDWASLAPGRWVRRRQISGPQGLVICFWAQCWSKLTLVHSLLFPMNTQAQQRQTKTVDHSELQTGCPGLDTSNTWYWSVLESLPRGPRKYMPNGQL